MVQYTFAHRTEGSEMWAHIAKFPERQKNSNRAMKAQSFDGVWSVGLFPFAEKIKALNLDTDASTPLVVDIGGGAGHTSAKIRELCKVSKLRFISSREVGNLCNIQAGSPEPWGGDLDPNMLIDGLWSWHRPRTETILIYPRPLCTLIVILCADTVLEPRKSTERLFYKISQRWLRMPRRQREL